MSNCAKIAHMKDIADSVSQEIVTIGWCGELPLVCQITLVRRHEDGAHHKGRETR